MNSQENEIFSCTRGSASSKYTWCSLKNLTLTTKSPNYTDTDEIKNTVKALMIENGKLRELPEKLFFNYRQLTDVIIIKCGLSQITTESFKSAINLNSISMRSNKIVNLNSNIFNDCKMLKSLDLSDNLIENIGSNVFLSIVKLLSLDLSNNRIKDIGNLIFSNMQFLVLNNNQIEEMSRNILNVTYVNLQNNLLSSLKIGKNVASIDASNNKVSKIIVDEGSSVESITLTDNSLTDLRNVSKCTNLKYLKLSNNNIQVKLDSFSGLLKLEKLDISKNNGTIVDLGFLKPLQSLKSLKVQKGAITNYNFENILKIIPDIRQVELIGDTIQMDYKPYSDYEDVPMIPRQYANYHAYNNNK